MYSSMDASEQNSTGLRSFLQIQRMLKNVDFFRKPTGDLARPTCLGALITIIVCALFFLMSANEFFHHCHPHTTREFFIRSQITEQKVPLNVDFLFFHVPCSLILIEARDHFRLFSKFAFLDFDFERISSAQFELVDHNYVSASVKANFNSESQYLQKVITGIQEKEMCRVKGTTMIKIAPGGLEFSFHRRLISVLTSNFTEGLKNIDFSHMIMELSFGANETQNNLLQDLGHIAATEFDRASRNQIILESGTSCNYFLKLLPHIYSYSPASTSQIEGYQYSFFRDCFQSKVQNSTIKIFFDPTPFTVRYTKNIATFPEYLVIIAGIACGLKVIGELIHSVGIHLMRRVKLTS